MVMVEIWGEVLNCALRLDPVRRADTGVPADWLASVAQLGERLAGERTLVSSETLERASKPARNKALTYLSRLSMRRNNRAAVAAESGETCAEP